MEEELAQINRKLGEIRRRLEHKRRLEHDRELAQQRLAGERARLEAISAEFDRARRQLNSLTGFNLRGLILRFFGNREDMVQAERQKLLSAQLRQGKCQVAVTALEQSAADMQRQLRQLQGCESEFRTLLQAKESLMLSADNARAPELLEIREALRYTQLKIDRLVEARQAGKETLTHLRRVVEAGRRYTPGKGVRRLFEEVLPVLKQFTRRLDRLVLASQDMASEVNRFIQAMKPLLDNPDELTPSLAGDLDRIIAIHQQIETILGMLAASQVNEQNQLIQLKEAHRHLVESAT